MSVATTYAGYSPDWWTPPEWLAWVRSCLGDYYDPCPGDWDPSQPSGLEVAWPPDMPVYVNHPGGRGQAQLWWDRTLLHKSYCDQPAIWCAFSIEQLRTLLPSPLEIGGCVILPRTRIAYLWGGPTIDGRVHGQPAKSPSSWSVFWCSATVNVEPPPVDSLLLKRDEAIG